MPTPKLTKISDGHKTRTAQALSRLNTIWLIARDHVNNKWTHKHRERVRVEVQEIRRLLKAEEKETEAVNASQQQDAHVRHWRTVQRARAIGLEMDRAWNDASA